MNCCRIATMRRSLMTLRRMTMVGKPTLAPQYSSSTRTHRPTDPHPQTHRPTDPHKDAVNVVAFRA